MRSKKYFLISFVPVLVIGYILFVPAISVSASNNNNTPDSSAIIGSRSVCTGEWVRYSINEDIAIPEGSEIIWSLAAGSHRAYIVGLTNQDDVWVEVGESFGSFGLQLSVFLSDDTPLLNETSLINIMKQGPPRAVLQKKGNNMLLVNQQAGPSFDSYQWGYTGKEERFDFILDGQVLPYFLSDSLINTSQYFYWVETSINSSQCIRRAFYNHPSDVATGVSALPESLSYTIFPVPATDFLTIRRERSTIPIQEVWLTDIMGKRLLMYRHMNEELGNELLLEVKGFPEGVYIITIKTENRLFHHKVLLGD